MIPDNLIAYAEELEKENERLRTELDAALRELKLYAAMYVAKNTDELLGGLK